jgi:hypothetical protein
MNEQPITREFVVTCGYLCSIPTPHKTFQNLRNEELQDCNTVNHKASRVQEEARTNLNISHITCSLFTLRIQVWLPYTRAELSLPSIYKMVTNSPPATPDSRETGHFRDPTLGQYRVETSTNGNIDSSILLMEFLMWKPWSESIIATCKVVMRIQD